MVSCSVACMKQFFFFNDTAPTEIYTLSLHDALPILLQTAPVPEADVESPAYPARRARLYVRLTADDWASLRGRAAMRSEEHSSELQSQSNLVCRLLLEKKNNHPPPTAQIFESLPICT